ncbi:hypothetical protein Bpfe_012967 [Biomphalaria pfeifferi]|uniref:Uncharacterized protein n=1 Tax=Biomphalaria pfeifferi TaxID=112525 RepID=A0AAD8FAH2_BIOPF|nr:hypothetical protein Bpfe_012967 [Biomphalaria pfeifferi]
MYTILSELFFVLAFCFIRLGLTVGHNNEGSVLAQEHSHIPVSAGNRVEPYVHAPETSTLHNASQNAPPDQDSSHKAQQDIVVLAALSGHIPNSNGNGNAYGKLTLPTLINILSGSSTPAYDLDHSHRTPTWTQTTESSDGNTQKTAPVLSGVMCYDEGPLVIQKNLPCEEKGLPKGNLTGQTLAQLLRNEGGGVMGDLISFEPPAHLRNLDLQTLNQSSWLNQNATDILLKLQEMLHYQKQHQAHTKQNIQFYLSKGDFSNMLLLAHSLIKSLEQVFVLNICTVSFSELGEISSDNEKFSSCVILVSEVDNMKSIHEDLLGVLTQDSDNVPSVQIEVSVSRGLNDDNNSHLSATLNATKHQKINELLQKLKDLQEDTKHLVFLHSRLLNATVSFQQALRTFESDLFKKLMKLSLFNNSVQRTSEEADSKTLVGTLTMISNSSINENTPILAESFTNISSVVELLKDLKSNLTYLANLMSEANVTLPEPDPLIDTWAAWNSLNLRVKRSITGFAFTEEVCQRQGSLINQTNYLSLCTTCVKTTVLDSNYFPRYLTEKVCDRGTSNNPLYHYGCLNIPEGQEPGRPGGLCQQQQIHVILLRKIPGRCMKIRSQGQEMITDQWESTTHPLRVGCECVINQNSALARMAVFP